MSASSDFERTLDIYKTNLTEFKTSGNAAYKAASETAKKWLDDYLKRMEERAENNKKEIEEFVKTQNNSDKELVSLKNDMKKIREEGPELQVLYETEKEAENVEEMDFTVYYSKGAVLLGVGVLIAVASFI